MSDERRLCNVKNELINIAVKLANEDKIPRWRYELDTLKCPAKNHCDPNRPCMAWRDREIRQQVAKLEDELFVAGFVRADANDLENYGREKR